MRTQPAACGPHVAELNSKLMDLSVLNNLPSHYLQTQTADKVTRSIATFSAGNESVFAAFLTSLFTLT